MSVVPQIVLYGILAAFSPTVLLATLAVLASGRGRLNGSVFLVAFVVGQVTAFVLAYLVGAAFSLREDTAGTVSAALEVAGGGALVLAAWSRRGGRDGEPVGEAMSGSRSEALFARLHHVRPAVSFGVGLPLGVGVKRLVIALLAAATIAAAGLDRPDEVGLGALYVVVACSVVWVPVLVYLVLGAHADELMSSVQQWITRHERSVLVYTAMVFGIFLILDGGLALLL